MKTEAKMCGRVKESGGKTWVQREVVGYATIYSGQKMSDFLSLPPLLFILVSESHQTLPSSSDFLIATS